MKYIVFIVIFLTPMFSNASAMPNFSDIKGVQERKSTFFNYLLPMISRANKEILRDRAKLEAIISGVAAYDDKFIIRLSKTYRVSGQSLSALLLRVDIIPPSLALSQGANESNWGRSRFMRQGNAAFGEWCFEEGCGVVPRFRPSGEVYEVESFSTVYDSVKSYIRNLNSGKAYEELRYIRSNYRKSGLKITGFDLAHGLTKYSPRKSEYVYEIQQMISYNRLASLD